MRYEGEIMNAINDAKKRMVRPIKLGIPEEIQRAIVTNMLELSGKPLPDKIPKLQELFGLPVEESESLQITTELPRIKQPVFI